MRLLAGRSVELRSLATKEWTLCPETDAATPTPLYLEGAIESIKALSPWRSWDTERALISGAKQHFSATRAHLLEKVDIVGAYLYCGPAVDKPGYGRQRLVLRDSIERLTLEEANLTTTFSGSHFFGALLLDDFPIALIADDPAKNITMTTKHYEHEAAYRELMGVADIPVSREAYVKELVIFTDPPCNPSRAARYRILRSRIRSALAASPGAGRPGVYIKRGRTGELRCLDNEEEIDRFFADIGFDIIDPALLSAKDIALRTLDAKIVVGVEGSHLSHAIYTMADDAAFLVFEPPDRFALPYKEFADCLDMKFAFLVGKQSRTGFTIPLADLQLMLDLLETSRLRSKASS